MEINNISSYLKCMKEYTELRVQENNNMRITLVNGNVVSNQKFSKGGVSARVNMGGYWGFSSNPEVKDETIKLVIDEANQNAKYLFDINEEIPFNLDKEKISEHKDFKTKKERWSQNQIMNFLKEIDTYILNKYPNVSRRINLNSIDVEKTLLTSNGTESYLYWPGTWLIIELTVKKENVPYVLYQSNGGLGNFEDNFDKPENLYSKIDELYKKVINKSEGVYAQAGEKECILDANLAGILAHEAIGHTLEGDLVINGSVGGPNLNKKVASELITLIDCANTYRGEPCPVPLYIDDEGTKAEDAVLIENGVLKSFMNNKETANVLKMESTGNARAFEYSDEPLVRMRNTIIVPGKDKFEDMIASIDDGYYFVKSGNGQADLTGEFMFAIVEGYEIKNGKIGKAIKDTTISGVAFDVLKSVTMISDDMKWNSSGMCGKKQSINVSMGGPAIKCKINVGGR